MFYDLEEHNSILEYLQSLTLLCVEDNKSTQVLYDSILKDLVKDIVFANDGEDGYTKFLQNDIDIIISDFDMPRLNGLQMIEKIRKKSHDIPIILVTGVENTDVLMQALQLSVSNFLKKPIRRNELLEILKKASSILIANDFLERQRAEKLAILQEKNSYNSYQEDLAFAKELNILRNDFYYQMIDSKHITLIDFLYQPLDVISGDAYSARKIDENRTFYVIVDGMGKGLSASLTAMIMVSFINHLVDKMIEHDSFSLHILLQESLAYIKPILLDEEAVAIDYVLFDIAYDNIQYAKFAMPALLMQDNRGKVIKLKSNNPPLSKWSNESNIDEYTTKNIQKILFYSDGVVENTTKDSSKTYTDYIEEDFANSFTREDLKNKFFEKIEAIEDDLTLIFINRLSLGNALLEEKSFKTTLKDIDKASEWYSNLLASLSSDMQVCFGAELVFTELYMNAFEHGNLGITAKEKHILINNDVYFETLKEKELLCDKKIHIKVSKITHASTSYLLTYIQDEGNGFDTQILSEIFRNSQQFNGRGVFVSRKNSLGIYYNSKGNSVLYLNKI